MVAALAASTVRAEHVSRLHRDRASLSIVAQAYLALALVDMQRAPMAREVAEALAERASVSPSGGTAWSAEENTGWNRCEIETSALVVLALERALPTSPRIAEGVAHARRAPLVPGAHAAWRSRRRSAGKARPSRPASACASTRRSKVSTSVRSTRPREAGSDPSRGARYGAATE
jgi:hypothetical protein